MLYIVYLAIIITVGTLKLWDYNALRV